MPPRKSLKIYPSEIESGAVLTETIKLYLNAMAVLATRSKYCTNTAAKWHAIILNELANRWQLCYDVQLTLPVNEHNHTWKFWQLWSRKDFLLIYDYIVHITMKDDRLRNLWVLEMQGFRLSLNVDNWNMQSLWLNITEECVLQVFYMINMISFQ